MKRVLVYPDVQIPYHNPLQVRALNRFIGEWQPDELLYIGDFMDFPEPSVWNKNTRAEFEGSIFRDVEIGKRHFGEIRSLLPFGLISFLVGNHDSRPAAYLAKHAPALDGSDAFHARTLLDFDGFGIVEQPPFYEFAPGWVATHGHLDISLSQIGGRTASLAAEQLGRSVVMGHTHRLGIISETKGYAGKAKTLTGVEVGHVMDMRPGHTPKWLKKGMANWQSGFAVLYIEGSNVFPVTVPMKNDGSFIFEGRWHRAKETVSV